MDPSEYEVKKARFWNLLKTYLQNRDSDRAYIPPRESDTFHRPPPSTVSKASPKPPWPKPSVNQYKIPGVSHGPEYPRVPFPTETSRVYHPGAGYQRPRGPSRYNPAGIGLDPGYAPGYAPGYGGPGPSGNAGYGRVPWYPTTPSTTLDPYDSWLRRDGVYVTRPGLNITSTTPFSAVTTTAHPTSPDAVSFHFPDILRPSKDPLDFADIASGSDSGFNNASYSNSSVFNTTLCDMPIIEDSKWIYLYGIAFLVAVALLLNGVSFGVFNTKALRRFAFSSYLAALALADTLALLSQIPRLWMTLFYEALGWDGTLTIYDDSEIACKSLTYVSYVFRFLSAWITIALLAERTYVAGEPFRKSNFRKRNSAYKFTLYILILAMVVNCHVVFTWTIIDTGDGVKTCSPDFPSTSLSYTVTVVTVIIIIGLPFVITSILTLILVRGVNSRAWHLRPQRMTTAAIFRLELERRASVMVAMVTAASGLLSLPYVLTWAVLLAQPWFQVTTVCERLAATAIRDVTEVIFMANYTIKFLLCIFGGNNILNLK